MERGLNRLRKMIFICCGLEKIEERENRKADVTMD